MEYTQKLDLIVQNLKKSQKVNSYDKGNEIEAGNIAHALLDMDTAFKEIINLLPKLYNCDLSEENVEEILLDIGEEVRHILYHIKDMKFYDYLTY